MRLSIIDEETVWSYKSGASAYLLHELAMCQHRVGDASEAFRAAAGDALHRRHPLDFICREALHYGLDYM
jgi:hypothetical protein